MSNPEPYLVVGSGISALVFSALMSRAGHRVVVLEAHYVPGGYGHTFRFGKPPDVYAFNAQLHYVWNCGPGETVNRVLDRLGLVDAIPFERLSPDGFDRMRMPGHALDIPNDWTELARRVNDAVPGHATAIAAFLDEVQATAAEIDALPSPPRTLRMLTRLHRFRRVIRYRQATLQQVFDRFGLPQAAQTLIALQWPDFLLPPRDLSFFAWLMLFTGYMRGAYYPKHHFEHVINSLVDVITQAGGEVRLNRRVTGFLMGASGVEGVRVEEVDDDGAATGGAHEIRASRVICNMDPRRASELIGPEHFPKTVRAQLNYDYSPSNFMAYCVVDGVDLRDHGFGRNNLFHTENPDLNACFDAMINGDYSRPSFAMTVPTLLTDDRSDCPEGKTVVELLTVADYERFKHLKFSKPNKYLAKKREVFDSMVNIIERDYVPGFRDAICFKMLGSPTTNERYALSPRGHSYGSNLTPGNMGSNRLSHQSGIDGLSFCSASAGYAGFAGTFWTGARLFEVMTGDSILG